ncbi:MAG: hypothetical protein HC819_03315 [Cyclobacteriaceae bacterium]|nr:hypothetical protein [Cyclobacteriaceae bacterium]
MKESKSYTNKFKHFAMHVNPLGLVVVIIAKKYPGFAFLHFVIAVTILLCRRKHK